MTKIRRATITTEIFTNRIFDLVGDEYSVLGEYIKANVKILMKHNICNHEWLIIPGAFTSAGNRCPSCSTNNAAIFKTLTTQKFKIKVYELVKDEYEVIGEYAKSDEQIFMKHVTCGNVFPTKPEFFLRGNRCPNCRKRHKAFTAEEFREILINNHGDKYELIGDYKNSYTDITVKNNMCGHTYDVHAQTLLKKNKTNKNYCKICAIEKKEEQDNKPKYERDDIDSVNKELYKAANEYIAVQYTSKYDMLDILHDKCGSHLKATKQQIINGSKRCMECYGPMNTTKKIKKKVKELVGDEFIVTGEFTRADEKIEFTHEKCGQTFMCLPSGFIKYPTCRVCELQRNTAYSTEEFKEKIRLQTNGEFELTSEYIDGEKLVTAKHHKCGNEYSVTAHTLNDKVPGSMCPSCSSNSLSRGEEKIKNWLTEHLINYRHQYSISECRNKYKLNFDFGILNSKNNLVCLIEFDGKQHYKIVKYFGGEEGFKRTQKNDKIKNAYCLANGIPLIRIPYWDFKKIDEILAANFAPIFTPASKMLRQMLI